jgi:hypothetical protein
VCWRRTVKSTQKCIASGGRTEWDLLGSTVGAEILDATCRLCIVEGVVVMVGRGLARSIGRFLILFLGDWGRGAYWDQICNFCEKCVTNLGREEVWRMARGRC